jgi:bifunctional non-homologous end joining protein LigD
MLLRAASYGFIKPALPCSADDPPIGGNWIHEIKHDGYRLMVRRDGAGVRLLTRNGRDWSARFPLILETAGLLRVRSCLIDGEAVVCNDNGLAVFERLRRKHEAKSAFLYAFDLLELDGVDLRREPIETRKATLASVLRGSGAGLRLNEHFLHAGDVVFRHACRMGLEGIVSKRLGSRYVSGRTNDEELVADRDCHIGDFLYTAPVAVPSSLGNAIGIGATVESAKLDAETKQLEQKSHSITTSYFASCPVRPSAGNSPRRKNPTAPAVKREAEEQWGKDRWR